MELSATTAGGGAAAVAETGWDAEAATLATRLGGEVSLADVRRWKESLERELARIPDGARFRMIVDLTGYDVGDLEAHKEMRVVVPLTLAAYGHRTALLDLFDPVDLPIGTTRGITCVAVAHVHHDAEKMRQYDERIARDDERFFTDAASAEAWIRGIA